MRKISNNVIAVFMALFMVITLINTILVSYYVEKKYDITGRAASLGGTVEVVINEPSPSLGGGAGGGGGGGGGGFGGERTPVTHILNFIYKNYYTLQSYPQDKYVAIFPGSNYTFTNNGYFNNSLALSILDFKFYVRLDELVKLDLDLDNTDDLSIKFDGKYMSFTSLHIPEFPATSPPKISIEKIVEEPGLRLPYSGTNFFFIFVILLLLIIAILAMQHRKIKKLETKEEKEAVKIYTTFRYSKKTKPKTASLEAKKDDVYEKLLKQKSLLEESYKLKYISLESYNKGKERIDSLLRKVKKSKV
ncbi:MAG: hypothetical protein AABW41_04725 [Nanoarchaeota archaeon]